MITCCFKATRRKPEHHPKSTTRAPASESSLIHQPPHANASNSRNRPLIIATPRPQLCSQCQALSFKLHLREDCESLNCHVEDFTSVSLHSELLLHFSSMVELETSAGKGCHLCSLLTVGLQSASRIPTNRNAESRAGVYICFECETTNPHRATERLIATCGPVVTQFDVVDFPGNRCSEPNFASSKPRTGPPDLHDIKFRAVYLGVEILDHQLWPGEVRLSLMFWS